jgi:hypothetical protein
MYEPWRLTILWTSTNCYKDSFSFYMTEAYNSLHLHEPCNWNFHSVWKLHDGFVATENSDGLSHLSVQALLKAASVRLGFVWWNTNAQKTSMQMSTSIKIIMFWETQPCSFVQTRQCSALTFLSIFRVYKALLLCDTVALSLEKAASRWAGRSMMIARVQRTWTTSRL